MGEISCRVVHIAEVEYIKLSVPCTTRGMNGKQNGPCYQTPRKGNGTENSEKAKKEIPVHRRMVKDVSIVNLEELPKPVQEA